MALRLEDKKEIVAEVSDVAAKAMSAVVADYRGLTVAEMTRLRAQAHKEGIYVKVVRNTLATIAVKDTSFACLTPALSGPTVLAFANDEPGKAARLIKEFAKTHDKLKVKALAVSGKYYDATHLDAVAKLPSRNEALSLLMSVIKAPVDKFVRTLAEPTAKFVRTVQAVADQKNAA